MLPRERDARLSSSRMILKMIVPPPPRPRPKRRSPWLTALGSVAAIALFVSAIFGIVYLVAPGGVKLLDNQFADQHLKTTIALLELHKVRYGKYPDSLRELKFTGQWDQIALQSVRYYTNADRTAYYVEVETGWIGKPNLMKMPDEFWRGTGYTTSLKPANR
jgi:hypothetical protein